MEKKTARLEAFSDGIFGVAITLLAVEIGIANYKGATNQNLWERIVEQWPEYFAYFNSFATVLLIWMGHQKILNRIRAATHWIILLNGLVLLLVVLFPFPTRMVGSFIGTPAESTAVVFYTAFTGCISLGMLLLNWGILQNKRLMVDPEKHVIWYKTLMNQQVVGILVYGLAAVIGLYQPKISLGITLAMWVYWAISNRDNEI